MCVCGLGGAAEDCNETAECLAHFVAERRERKERKQIKETASVASFQEISFFR